MRAGCVHLVFDLMCHADAMQWDPIAAASRLMAIDSFWRQGSYLAQLPNGAVKWHNGRITNLWEGNSLQQQTPVLQLGQSVQSLACIVSGQPARLRVTAQPALSSQHLKYVQKPRRSAKVLARYGGRFVVNPDLLDCTTCASQLSAARRHALDHASEGVVYIPGLEGVGVLHLEAEAEGFLSASQPVVVAPDQEVQQDVCKLISIVVAAG